jgi:Tfp pilus assembly protein PilF
MRRVIPAAVLFSIGAIALVRTGHAGVQTTGPAVRERAYRENNIGVARLEQFEYREAAASFQRAIAIDPPLAIAHLNLAIALLYDSQLENADREAALAGDAMPTAPQPLYVRGLIARAAGRDSDPAGWFRRVLALDPADVGGRIQLGQVLIANREYGEAAALMQQALNDEPFNATAAYGLAIALARAGRADEGREAMARFQQLRDNPASITYANVYMGQGRYAEAVASTGLEPELVDRAVPNVTFVDAAVPFEQPSATSGGDALPTLGDSFDPPSGQDNALARVLASRARTVTLADIDGDGAVDLLAPSGDSIAVVRNVSGRFSSSAATLVHVEGTMPLAGIAGDYDNDGRTDLFVLGFPENRLYRQNDNGQFVDVTQSAGIRQTGTLNGTAAFVDVDHDGDLDIVLGGLAALRTPSSGSATSNAGRFPDAFAPASNQLLRNDGNGRFTDVTAEAHIASSGHAVGIVPTDFDNHRDVDLLVLGYGDRVSLFSNSRDGTFRDVASTTGLPAADRYTAVAAGDVNKNGATDFFFGRRGAPGVLATSDGSGRFRIADAPDETRDAVAAQFVDYDDDGLLDLMVLTLRGARLWRNVGDAWVDVGVRALPNAALGASDPAVAIAFADIDADGDTDAVVRLQSGRLRLWRNDGGNAHRSLRIDLKARVSNRSGIGSKVEIRAGSLRQKIETSSATPAVAPADVVFGLGAREKADVVRVLWPAGIVQAEVDPPAPGARTNLSSLSVEELNRKPSSCPYLFYWNGWRFEFLTDFMGGGEMGSWLGPRVQNQPDPDEYVRIGRDRLKPRDGRYELRVTNELEEALFIDRLQLVAVSHPANVEVYPNEGLRSQAAREPFTVYTASAARAPIRAVDDKGRDITERIRLIDRRYVDDFALEPIQGYARPHALTISIDAADAERVLLLLTGWTDYAFSSDNLAAYQAGLLAQPPSLQVRTRSGGWRTIVEELGIPVGRPQTIAVDLTGKLLTAERGVRNVECGVPSTARYSCIVDLRIVTNMRVYWDQILVDTSKPEPVSVARIDPLDGVLRWRGYSAETSPDGREPFAFAYERVSAAAPWKTMPGKYTRFGDVRSLLSAADDRFVVSAPGDEIAVSFDAAALPNVPAGWTRTFLLYADGFSKEMNLHSSSPDRLEPLPFHGMKRYPYADPERYPQTPSHRQYRDQYNTRVVGGPLPPLSK